MPVKLFKITSVTKLTMVAASVVGDNFMFMLVTEFFVAVLAGVLQGFLDLQHILHSPFGPRALDVNHEGILYQGLGKTVGTNSTLLLP